MPAGRFIGATQKRNYVMHLAPCVSVCVRERERYNETNVFVFAIISAERSPGGQITAELQVFALGICLLS